MAPSARTTLPSAWSHHIIHISIYVYTYTIILSEQPQHRSCRVYRRYIAKSEWNCVPKSRPLESIEPEEAPDEDAAKEEGQERSLSAESERESAKTMRAR